MKLREHIVLGGLASAALAPTLGAQSLVFFASSVLIDVDHYWHFLESGRFRDFSVRRMFAYHAWLFGQTRRPEFLSINTFHTVEFFVLAGLVALQTGSPVVEAAILGGLWHMALDLIHQTWHGIPFKRALSIVEYALRRRRMLRRGLDPDLIFREAHEHLC